MDRIEAIVATRRLAKWPREWQRMILELPAAEQLLLMELAALLDARPAGEGPGQ